MGELVGRKLDFTQSDTYDMTGGRTLHAYGTYLHMY